MDALEHLGLIWGNVPVVEGYEWEDVRFVSCQYLRGLPTGPSIPEDAGPAPEP